MKAIRFIHNLLLQLSKKMYSTTFLKEFALNLSSYILYISEVKTGRYFLIRKKDIIEQIAQKSLTRFITLQKTVYYTQNAT